MFLQKVFLRAQPAARQPGRVSSIVNPLLPASAATGTNLQIRPYFSVFEKVKDRFRTPLRHIQSFTEPDGYNYQSQMPEGYRTHGNTAMSFSAALTQNSLELN